MRVPCSEDANNVDRIGSASNPGLRSNALTREQHRDRLVAKYRGRPGDLGTAQDLEDILDRVHGRAASTAVVVWEG